MIASSCFASMSSITLNRLNSRQHTARKARGNDSTEWNSIPLGGVSSSGGSATVADDRHVRVVVTRKSGNDAESVIIHIAYVFQV